MSGSAKVILLSKRRICVLHLKKDARLPDAGIHEKIYHWKTAQLIALLAVKFPQHRIITIHEIAGEVFKGNTCLQLQGTFEKTVLVI